MMKLNLKYSSLFVLFLIPSLYGKEISVFGAGNIGSENPYGLTKAEKGTLANSEKINSLTLKVDRLEVKQDELLLKLEGIKSLYESDSQTINSTKLNLRANQNKLEEQTIQLSDKIEQNSKKIDLLEKKLDSFIALQKQNNKLIEESNTKLLNIINKINSEYVRKVEFEELVSFVNKSPNTPSVTSEVPIKSKEVKVTVPEVIAKEPKKEIQEPVVKKQESKKLFDDALTLYEKNMITKALPMFEELVTLNYKVAESHFYLAEIKFRKKQYQQAIQSYKQSMIADDKASYIPTLLLHSAESFENMKEKENALKFYKTIVEVYPKTDEAKEAKKKLKDEESVSDKKVDNKKETTKQKKEKKDDKK